MKFGLILFLIVASSLRIMAQTIPGLLLPEHSNGAIHFDLSGIANHQKDKFNYDLLSVFVANETKEYTASLPMQGDFSKVENVLIFKPYFSFENGLTYVIRISNSTPNEFSYVSFKIGEREKKDQAKLLRIFPTANILPENLLRFYFYFQTPMQQEEALKHIKLIDDQGNIDDQVFMKFKEELWSNDGKRLTLLFDPGRIKRGVATNVRQGAALENGRRYQLNISGDWQDVYGQKLCKSRVKEITVKEPYRKRLNPDEWTVKEPTLASLDKLTINFDRIIDHTLIQAMIQIIDDTEHFVEGNWEIGNAEKQIHFVPRNKWQKGAYKIIFDTQLEDVTGNNLKNLLDHHILEQDIDEKFQFLKFVISN